MVGFVMDGHILWSVGEWRRFSVEAIGEEVMFKRDAFYGSLETSAPLESNFFFNFKDFH